MIVSYHISAESWDSWWKCNYIQVTSILTPATWRPDGWTFRFQNLPLKSYIWLCIFLPSRLEKITWLQGDSLRNHSVDLSYVRFEVRVFMSTQSSCVCFWVKFIIKQVVCWLWCFNISKNDSYVRLFFPWPLLPIRVLLTFFFILLLFV